MADRHKTRRQLAEAIHPTAISLSRVVRRTIRVRPQAANVMLEGLEERRLFAAATHVDAAPSEGASLISAKVNQESTPAGNDALAEIPQDEDAYYETLGSGGGNPCPNWPGYGYPHPTPTSPATCPPPVAGANQSAGTTPPKTGTGAGNNQGVVARTKLQTPEQIAAAEQKEAAKAQEAYNNRYGKYPANRYDSASPTTGNPVRLFDGQPQVDVQDLFSDGFGKTWGQTRSYSDAAEAPSFTQGANGNRWLLMNQPQLQQDATNSSVIIAFVSGLNQLWFDPQSGGYGKDRFDQGNNLSYNSTTDIYTLTDSTGGQSRFYGFGTGVTAVQRGQMKEYVDQSGNVTTLTYAAASDPSAPEGRLKTVTRSDGAGASETWRYTYLGSTDANAGLISKVELLRGSSLTLVREVAYAYYTGATGEHGGLGDLKSAAVGDAGGTISVTQYRYYTVTDNTTGHAGGLKYVFGPKTSANAAADNVNLATASDAAVSDYADNYFEYDEYHRVTKEVVRGEGCSCSGSAGQGEFTYAYEVRSTTNTGPNSWVYKTVETLPGDTGSAAQTNTYYANASGQIMLKVFTVPGPEHTSGLDKHWGWFQKYDANGKMVMLAEPSALDLPSELSTLEAYDDLLHETSGNYQYIKDAAGLVQVFDWYTATAATATHADGVAGYFKSSGLRKGDTGSVVPQTNQTYFVRTAGGVTIYPVAEETVYRGTVGNLGLTTSYAYDWQGSTVQPLSVTTTFAAVGATQNGSGNATSMTARFDQFGRAEWLKDEAGVISYFEYDMGTGAITRMVTDVNTGIVTNEPSGWSTPSGGGLHLITQIQNDGLGRPVGVTDPNNNVTRTVYRDAAHEVRVYEGWNATTGTTTTPIGIYRENWGYRSSDSLTIAATPLTTGSVNNLVPTGLETFADGDLRSWTHTRETAGGKVGEVAEFVNLDQIDYVVADEVTSEGDINPNARITKYGYDKQGRLSSTTDPSGTITRYVYDDMDRVAAIETGTELIYYDGAVAGSNLQVVAEYEYDNGGIGNGTLTKETLYPHDPNGTVSYNDELVTENQFDWRDRLTATRGPDGIASVYTYDNLGQTTQVDNFVDYDTSPTAFTIDPGEWIGRTTMAYDERGQVYEASRYQGTRVPDVLGTDNGTVAKVMMPGHGFVTGQTVTIAGASQAAYNGTYTITKLNDDQFTYTPGGSLTGPATPSTGGRITITADKRLTNQYWYDARGNLIKSLSPSGLIGKTFFDSANRSVRSTLSADPAEVTTESYSDADDLSGDKVIEQYDVYLDKGGRSRISTNWKRDGSDTTSTGAATAGGFDHSSVAYWYDAADRLVATADYGRDGAEAGSASGDRLVWNATGATYKDSDSDTIPDVIDNAQDAGPGSGLGVGLDSNLDNPTSQTAYKWVYSGYKYDDAGNLAAVYDNTPRNATSSDTELRQTRYGYDLAGRTIAMVENYVNGTASETETDTDRTTLYGYDIFDRLETQTAKNPLGSGNGVQSQVTRFAYGSDFDRSQVTATLYGDTTSTVSVSSEGKGTVSGTDAIFTTYDNVGRVTETTDQRGVKHAYAYDAAGRLASDSINGTSSTVLSNMAAGIRTIAYAYDAEGRLSLVSSKNVSNAVRNQVGFTYDAWGNVIRDAQAHTGVVDPVVSGVTVASPSTRYTYADGSGTGTEAQYVRLAKTLYPTNNGTTLGTYVTTYETSDVGQALVRSSGVADGSAGQQIVYSYLGAGQITNTARPLPDAPGQLALPASLDRYNRWSEIAWNTFAVAEGEEESLAGKGGGQTDALDGEDLVDDRVYTYDRTGNRLTTDIVDTAINSEEEFDDGAGSNWDEAYAYDGLNRLVAWERGALSGSTIPNANSLRTQTWALDALGNWRTATDDLDGDSGSGTARTTAARTVNAANEISTDTGVNAATNAAVASSAYDAAGNVTSTQQKGSPQASIGYAYDAWNHQVGSSKTSTTTENNAFDGLGRLIAKGVIATSTDSGPSEDYFYNGQQVIEVRAHSITNGVPTTTTTPKVREQTLWASAVYVNAPAVVKLDDTGDGVADKTLYPTWDANFNVTAVVNPSGQAIERYAYEPYGTQTTLNGQSDYAGTGADEGGDFSFDWSGSDYANFLIGFQGMRYDPDSGTNITHSRRYLPGIGLWDGRDGSGTDFQDGMNLYQFVRSAPTYFVDSTGFNAVPSIDPVSTGINLALWIDFAIHGNTVVMVYTDAVRSQLDIDRRHAEYNAAYAKKAAEKAEQQVRAMQEALDAIDRSNGAATRPSNRKELPDQRESTKPRKQPNERDGESSGVDKNDLGQAREAYKNNDNFRRYYHDKFCRKDKMDDNPDLSEESLRDAWYFFNSGK